MELLSPWNLVFLLPAFAALLYLLLLSTGTVSAETGDADVDLDADIDLDAGVDLDADLDAGVDHGVEHAVGEGHPDGPLDGGRDGAATVLNLLGVGRIPLSLLAMTFCFLWGFLGWAGNLLFGEIFESEAVAFLPSLALALVGATVLTRTLAAGIGRLIPSVETYAVSHRELVGNLATVRYAVTERAGTAQLYDERGVLHEVPVRVRPGEDPIPSGHQVVLWNYDAGDNVFLVTHDPELDSVPRRAG
jgi:hypothetical protein